MYLKALIPSIGSFSSPHLVYFLPVALIYAYKCLILFTGIFFSTCRSVLVWPPNFSCLWQHVGSCRSVASINTVSLFKDLQGVEEEEVSSSSSPDLHC